MPTEYQELLTRLERVEATLAQPPKEFLTADEAAEFLSFSLIQLAEWRCKGGGPVFHKIGRRVAYSVADLRAFMAARRVER